MHVSGTIASAYSCLLRRSGIVVAPTVKQPRCTLSAYTQLPCLLALPLCVALARVCCPLPVTRACWHGTNGVHLSRYDAAAACKGCVVAVKCQRHTRLQLQLPSASFGSSFSCSFVRMLTALVCMSQGSSTAAHNLASIVVFRCALCTRRRVIRASCSELAALLLAYPCTNGAAASVRTLIVLQT
jgi:hypothetical protein